MCYEVAYDEKLPNHDEGFKVKNRGHPDLNWGPLDLQSNALPLSYAPTHYSLLFMYVLIRTIRTYGHCKGSNLFAKVPT